jgi:antitoxin component of MazEF toxin-antitoxin module
MPAKSDHKIMKHGTSGVVVIPKPYRDYYNLKTGTTVTVLYNSLLLIIPKNQEHVLKEKAELIEQLLGQSKRLETTVECKRRIAADPP